MKVYVVVMRMTQTDDDAEVFLTKRSAKAFIKRQLQAYITARNKENIGARILTLKDVESYKGANGDGYSLFSGITNKNCAYSAVLVEKEL